MPTAPDKLVDQSVRHAVYLERYKSGAVNEFDRFLGVLEKSILLELSGDVTEWNRARLNKQLVAIRKAMKPTLADINSLMNSQAVDLNLYEADFEIRSLSNVIDYDFDLPSDKQLTAALYSTPLAAQGVSGTLLKPYYKEWSARTIARVNGTIRLGYAQGLTTEAIKRTLAGTGGTMDLVDRDLAAVVRTGLAHSAQVARNDVWQENKQAVKGVRITATLDDRTSSICRSLDGRIFPIDKGPRPPFHINCRTTTTAALDSRFNFLDEGATRSARTPETGKVTKVSAGQSYYDWLKKQPAAIQDDIIGKDRGKLLRNGGITTKRFAELQLNKKFEPITLEQMKKRDRAAFKKAGILHLKKRGG